MLNKPLIGCGLLVGLIVVGVALFALLSGPGHAPSHPFDAYQMDGEACIQAFDGRDVLGFDHIWILRSPDLQAWWGPNGMRADAELLLDSGDRRLITDLLGVAAGTPKIMAGSSQSPNHVRTLSNGLIYHVLLFSSQRSAYAHLRFEYRSEQRDGSTVYHVLTDFNGSHPIKDCPGFSQFLSEHLLNPK